MDPHVSPPAASTRTDADVLAAARSLIPQVLAARDECERLRHVPTPMVEALAEAGLLQMYLPRSMGGPELPPLVVFRVVEEISRADGSIGWCTMIATGVSNSMGLLEAEVGREMAGCPADMRLAGSIRPMGRARPVEGGHRVDGRWDFASGVNHARWLMCPCVIWDDGKPVRTPTGVPMTRIFWAPAESATILDTWHVVGLRGTGSHDFALADVFVPAARSVANTDLPREKGLLYDPRLHLSWIWTATVANAIGIARGALDAFTDLASTKSSTMSTTLLRDRPLVQARVAEAEATLSAARAYVQTAVGDLWERAGRGESDLDVAVVQARLAIARGMHEAVHAVDLLFHAAGTNAVYERNPLERHFRNIHVAVQHAAALPAHMEAAGKVLLGLRPSDAGW
jgi:alkylation response protein AidB-like acyl-CoA dehydrogenase